MRKTRRSQQLAMMELYKREKANPLSGCVPMLLTHSGVLLALQGSLSSPSRCARRLSMAGSTICPRPIPPRSSICSGFCPITSRCGVAGFLLILSIGIWPILMGFTQFVQTKLNPAPDRSGAGQDVHLHAADLHLHVRHLPGGAGDLLLPGTISSSVTQQCDHHAARRREGESVREYQARRKN